MGRGGVGLAIVTVLTALDERARFSAHFTEATLALVHHGVGVLIVGRVRAGP